MPVGLEWRVVVSLNMTRIERAPSLFGSNLGECTQIPQTFFEKANLMNTLFMALRLLHIGAGATALFVGPVALAVVKGGPRHLFWGKVYVWAMGVVAVTAFPMAVYKNNTFLFLIGVFSSYLAFSGWRVIRRQRARRKAAASSAPADPPLTARLLDAVPATLMVAAAVPMFFLGGRNILSGVSFGWVLCVFGSIALLLVAREIPLIFRPLSAYQPDDKKWLGNHIGRMIGAYAATLTAFSAVNMRFLPPLVAWLWPTVLLLPFIIYNIRKYQTAPTLPPK